MDYDAINGIRWWNALDQLDRAYWCGRARSSRPYDAYRVYKAAGRPTVNDDIAIGQPVQLTLPVDLRQTALPIGDCSKSEQSETDGPSSTVSFSQVRENSSR
ncbi:hypothetical protein V5738_08830 [Salinisphaera sp. SPP-AMP-43]|uniref:hypothetical protein n=1 Tax=Salinisphaera sp. SPP-AMP-43 TaxID=3121288 RepID=UPI003C6E3BF2